MLGCNVKNIGLALIEVFIGVAIVVILVAIVIPNIQGGCNNTGGIQDLSPPIKVVSIHKGTKGHWGQCTVIDSTGVLKTFEGQFGESLALSYNPGGIRMSLDKYKRFKNAVLEYNEYYSGK
jgi:hypothetical protein